jgi:hypothetical protein
LLLRSFRLFLEVKKAKHTRLFFVVQTAKHRGLFAFPTEEFQAVPGGSES